MYIYIYIYIYLKFKMEIGIAIKQVAIHSYLAKILLATHGTGSIGYVLCLFMPT